MRFNSAFGRRHNDQNVTTQVVTPAVEGGRHFDEMALISNYVQIKYKNMKYLKKERYKNIRLTSNTFFTQYLTKQPYCDGYHVI